VTVPVRSKSEYLVSTSGSPGIARSFLSTLGSVKRPKWMMQIPGVYSRRLEMLFIVVSIMAWAWLTF
jgi:hypothetical protein